MTLVSQRITLVAAVLMVITLALGLVIPKVAGAGFLSLALLAVLWLTHKRAWLGGGLMALERLFVFSIVLFVSLWLIAWSNHGLDMAGRDAAGRMLRLLLIVPIFLFIRRLDGRDEAWWLGLVLGGWITGLFAWWFFLTGQVATYEQRVEGATNPIYFGGITLAMAMMLLPKLMEPNARLLSRWWVGGAIVMAFSASLFSGSRGAWLALIPLLVLFSLTLGRRYGLWWRVGLPAVAGVCALVILLIPAVPTSERFVEGFLEIQQLTQGEMTEGALGRRWQMWTLAMAAMEGHWWTGIGPGEFARQLQTAINQGQISELLAQYRHPHSQYLSALTDGGIPLLVAWILLLASAARRFFKLYSSGLRQTQQFGWAGLSAITLMAVMALSESIFERNVGIVWFGFFIAVSMGLVSVQKRRELANRSKRNESLSVIVITKNEADRIERCLASVADWADEVIVLDSGSEDKTPDLARQYTSNVHLTDWPGYGLQKQRALDQATCDWVLSIDADEQVSEALKAEIDVVLSQSADPKQAIEHRLFVAYTLPWLTHAFGTTLRHGRWSRTPLRLVKRGHAHFTPLAVHESLILEKHAKSGHLDSPLHHFPYRDEAHAKAKLRHYAQLQSQNKRSSRHGQSIIAIARALLNFLDNYILRAAFLDGRAGFKLSRLIAHYTYQKYRPEPEG